MFSSHWLDCHVWSLINNNLHVYVNRVQALNKYRHLISLLRGEFPAGILPPTPDGYVVSRIQDLAGK